LPQNRLARPRTISKPPAPMAGAMLHGSHLSLVLNQHYEEDGAIVYREACKLGCEGIVSKRLGSTYRRGRSPHWVKVKNPNAPAVKPDAEKKLMAFKPLGPSDRLTKPHFSH